MIVAAVANLPAQSALKSSLFHEAWWLSAVTGARYEEAVVTQDGKVVGRLPYVILRRGPFTVSRMPAFTHLLGPLIDTGSGKPQTRLSRRLSIARSLIDQLPAFSLFEQHFDPLLDEGLAVADGLAFQDRGYIVSPQYTFHIDCRQHLEELWEAMHQKQRQPIRRAQEKYEVRIVDDPLFYTCMYTQNINKLGRINRVDFTYFPDLYRECTTRQCGEILGAFSADGAPRSMIFLVWSDTTMYLLMITRAPDVDDHGSVNLLLWSAMKKAHALGITLDLDGVHSSGTARFLSRFGGQIRLRLVARRARSIFGVLQHFKLRYSNNKTHFFT